MHTTYNRVALIALLLALVLGPASALAASKPTCELTVSSARGEVSTKKNVDVFALSGEKVTLSWESKNAKKAIDEEKDSVDLEDSKTIIAERNTSYSFQFSNGSKKVTCGITLRIAEGSFDASTLATDDTKPELSGEASGTKAVHLEVTNSSGKRMLMGKEVRLKKGEWEAEVTKTLKEGVYTAALFGEKKYELGLLATSTLTILPKGSSVRGGTISVAQLPLLGGGIAANGTSVPVEYLQVRNTGSTAASVKGFTLIENGSITDDVVTGFSVNDDKGGTRATYDNLQFKKSSVYVPLPYTLAAGEVRIFTIKAMLSPNKRLYGNAELKIDVASVDTTAKVTGVFPIRGTTWVLR